MTPHIRVVIFDDNSASTVRTAAIECAKAVGLTCVFRTYTDEWLTFAEEEANEITPALWLIDLYSKPQRDRGGEASWQRIEGWRDNDSTLDNIMRKPAVASAIRPEAQGVSVVLYISRLDQEKRNRIHVRVCSKVSQPPEIDHLLAYALRGDATADSGTWKIEKQDLIEDSTTDQHQKALDGLKAVMNEMKSLISPEPSVAKIPKWWPERWKRAYAVFPFLRQHIAVVIAVITVLIAIPTLYYTYLQTKPKPPEFVEVGIGDASHPNGHCVVGNGCPVAFENILKENTGINFRGALKESAFVYATLLPHVDDGFAELGSKRQFGKPYHLKNSGLVFLAVLASNSPLEPSLLKRVDRQLEVKRITKGPWPTGPGPYVCQGLTGMDKALTAMDNGGPLAIEGACQVLSDFINQDSQNRQALLVAFPVNSAEK